MHDSLKHFASSWVMTNTIRRLCVMFMHNCTLKNNEQNHEQSQPSITFVPRCTVNSTIYTSTAWRSVGSAAHPAIGFAVGSGNRKQVGLMNENAPMRRCTMPYALSHIDNSISASRAYASRASAPACAARGPSRGAGVMRSAERVRFCAGAAPPGSYSYCQTPCGRGRYRCGLVKARAAPAS